MSLLNLFLQTQDSIPPGYSGVVSGDKNIEPLKVINFVTILFFIIIAFLTAYTIFLHHKINKLTKDKTKEENKQE